MIYSVRPVARKRVAEDQELEEPTPPSSVSARLSAFTGHLGKKYPISSAIISAGWSVTKFIGRQAWDITPGKDYITGAASKARILAKVLVGGIILREVAKTEIGSVALSKMGSLAVSGGAFAVEKTAEFAFQQAFQTADSAVTGGLNLIKGDVDSWNITETAQGVASKVSSVAGWVLRILGSFGSAFTEMSIPGQLMIGGGALLYYGTPRLKKKVHQFFVGPDLPRLAKEESFCQTPLGAYVQKVIKDLEWEKPWIKKIDESKPVLNKDVKERVEPFIAANKKIADGEGGFFKNMLLLGPPGTGKTMLAKHIAKESGMNYIEIDGGTFARYEHWKPGTALRYWRNLFEYIEQSGRPVLLLIDEADGMLPKVSDDADAEVQQSARQFRSAVLAATGVSNKLLLVLTTNHVNKMDEALVSRVQMRVKITPPNLDARIEMLTKYIDKYFGESPERKTCLNDEKIKELAEKTKGMSGRDLMFLVDNFVVAKRGAPNKTLSPEMMAFMLDLALQAFRGDYDSEVPAPVEPEQPAVVQKVESSSEKVADKNASDQPVAVNAK